LKNFEKTFGSFWSRNRDFSARIATPRRKNGEFELYLAEIVLFRKYGKNEIVFPICSK